MIIINIMYMTYTINRLNQVQTAVTIKHICNNRPCCADMMKKTHPNIKKNIEKIIQNYNNKKIENKDQINLYKRTYKLVTIKTDKNKITVILDNINQDERINYTCYKGKCPKIKILSKSNLKTKTIKAIMSAFGPLKFIKSFVF